MRWNSAALALFLGAISLLGCQQVDEYGCDESSYWPGRPGCQPVGTTVTSILDCGRGDSCVETRWYDEIGEANFREQGMP